MNAIIYQLPTESNNIFRGYNKEKFDFSEYKKVYEWYITEEETDGGNTYRLLDDIFYIFNCQHPNDFKGHSLSVSDIVVLGDNYYYCDSIGWKNISKEIF